MSGFALATLTTVQHDGSELEYELFSHVVRSRLTQTWETTECSIPLQEFSLEESSRTFRQPLGLWSEVTWLWLQIACLAGPL